MLQVFDKVSHLFGRLYWNFLFGYLPMWIITSTLTLFEIFPVNFNNEKVYGIKGFAISFFYLPLIPIAMAAPIWISIQIGYFIVSFFRKKSVDLSKPEIQETKQSSIIQEYIKYLSMFSIKPVDVSLHVTFYLLIGMAPFYVLSTLIALFSDTPINVAGLQLYGLEAVAGSLLYSVFIISILGLVTFVWISFGNWIRQLIIQFVSKKWKSDGI